MSNGIHVRDARQDDAAAIAVLLGELGYPCDEAAADARLAALRQATSHVRVAIADDRIVGLASAHHVPTIHADGGVTFITSLVVAESARRQGVGRRLLESLQQWSRRHGCHRLLVTSGEHRTGAHRFYERSGFVHSGLRFTKALSAEGG